LNFSFLLHSRQLLFFTALLWLQSDGICHWLHQSPFSRGLYHAPLPPGSVARSISLFQVARLVLVAPFGSTDVAPLILFILSAGLGDPSGKFWLVLPSLFFAMFHCDRLANQTNS
jgi:hypothetical protein